MRKCGTCSACCRWPAIKELGKLARVPCRHLHKQGFSCTIYADRPEACSSYRCSWLRGMGDDVDRPNDSGVMIDRRNTQFGVVLVAHQLKPGAAMRHKGINAIERATRDEGLPCLVVDYEDSERVIGVAGPPEFAKAVEAGAIDGVIHLGGTLEHINNVVARTLQGLSSKDRDAVKRAMQGQGNGR